MYWIFAIGGYVGAFLTAFYSFRIGFRVVYGEPCAEARELEQGHLAHGEPVNPATGEPEDTDVGFPGAEHHIAEREWPMRVAMGTLGFLALFGGLIQIPGVDDVLESFLEATFESSTFAGLEPSTGQRLARAAGRRRDLDRRHRARLLVLHPQPRRHRAARRAPARLHSFLLHKWYFDELEDGLVYRPAIAIGRFANSVFERVVVNGIVSATTGAVRGHRLDRARRAVGLRPRLRAAADRRLRGARRLLPGGGELMLNFLLWVPLVAGALALPAPRGMARWLGVAGSVAALGLAIAMTIGFDSGTASLQYVVDESWIPDLGVRYQLGVDGISVFLVLMTAVLWAAATLWSALRDYPHDGRSRLYFLLLGIGETAALGAFIAQDLLLFVLFFDLMLIPFFFLIGAFGGENRIAATTKMLVYTLVGSLLMLVGAIATAILVSQQTGGELTFSIPALREALLSSGSQEWIFCFFAAAFLVKMPAFPIHGWMPDAYRAAPLPVLLLLSGVLSKVGAYGFLRVVLPLFPDATSQFQELILIIALISILYGSVMAFTQTNVRLVAGYSSIAQLGFITLGIFSLRADGADGSVLQMVNHGLVVAGTFFIIALLFERTGTEDLRRMGGQALRAPMLAALFLVVTMATLAMPGSANFIGEFYILNGVFQSKIVFAFVGIVGVALAAFYALRLYQRTMHNRLPEGVESREIARPRRWRSWRRWSPASSPSPCGRA